MALHRDIHWVGKQWAVTGHGLQACNQKQKGGFDIEVLRLWVDGVQEAVRAQKWVNKDDFDKAIAVARKYFPEPPRAARPIEKPAPVPESVSEPVVAPVAPLNSAPESPVKPAAAKFAIHSGGLSARLLPVWRIRKRVAARPDHR